MARLQHNECEETPLRGVELRSGAAGFDLWLTGANETNLSERARLSLGAAEQKGDVKRWLWVDAGAVAGGLALWWAMEDIATSRWRRLLSGSPVHGVCAAGACGRRTSAFGKWRLGRGRIMARSKRVATQRANPGKCVFVRARRVRGAVSVTSTCGGRLQLRAKARPLPHAAQRNDTSTP